MSDVKLGAMILIAGVALAAFAICVVPLLRDPLKPITLHEAEARWGNEGWLETYDKHGPILKRSHW